MLTLSASTTPILSAILPNFFLVFWEAVPCAIWFDRMTFLCMFFPGGTDGAADAILRRSSSVMPTFCWPSGGDPRASKRMPTTRGSLCGDFSTRGTLGRGVTSAGRVFLTQGRVQKCPRPNERKGSLSVSNPSKNDPDLVTYNQYAYFAGG